MMPKYKNLLIRTVVGAAYVALMVAGVFVFPLMDVLLCVAACIAIFECMRLVSGPVDRLSMVLLMVATVVQFAVILNFGLRRSSFFYNAEMMTLFMFVVVAVLSIISLSVALSVLELLRHRPAPLEHMGVPLFAYSWIVIPLGFLAVMTRVCPPLILAFLILIWTYDTFAYLGGTLYGRNKMCEHISPKKTWEGTVTGFIMTVVMAIVLPSIPYFGHLHIALWKWVVFAILIVLFGTVGDLLESLLKRRAGVKDSGSIMPGHGGMLDRFDSILIASIPALLFALTVMIP